MITFCHHELPPTKTIGKSAVSCGPKSMDVVADDTNVGAVVLTAMVAGVAGWGDY